MTHKDGRIRKNITPGSSVQIIRKQDQKSGFLTKGIVKEILTNSAKHPHGIKVKLTSGLIGRVRKVLSKKDEKLQEKEKTRKTGPVYNVSFLND